MSVSYTCPNPDCGVTLKTPSPVPPGKKVKCPKCGVAVAVLVARVGFVAGTTGGAAAVVSLWLGSEWLLSAHGVFLSPLLPTLGVVAAHAMMTLAKLSTELNQLAGTAPNGVCRSTC